MKSAIMDRLDGIITRSHASALGLAARQLHGGEELLVDADLGFHPASTIKLCIMMEAFHRARSGGFPLDGTIEVHNRFSSIADGASFSLDPADDSEIDLYQRIGMHFSRRELIRRMITVSSNLASNLLLEELEPARVTAFMRELGAEGISILRGFEDKRAYRRGLNSAATARGFMQILLKLGLREVVSPEDSDQMIEILCQQELNEMIPARLPRGTRVAHKTGWAADYHHDVGIVYPPRAEPFVLCILTKGYEESEGAPAHALIAALALAVYEHWCALQD